MFFLGITIMSDNNYFNTNNLILKRRDNFSHILLIINIRLLTITTIFFVKFHYKFVKIFVIKTFQNMKDSILEKVYCYFIRVYFSFLLVNI